MTPNPQPRSVAELTELLREPGGAEVLAQIFADHPILLVRAEDDDQDPSLIATSVEGFRTQRYSRIKEDDTSKWFREQTDLTKRGPSLEGEAICVAKSDRNPFVGIVTVGRAKNNDIILAASSVSKLQAFFRRSESGAWTLEDKNSTNQTTINGVKLDSDREYPVAIGDELVFGEIRCLLTDCEGLQALCRS